MGDRGIILIVTGDSQFWRMNCQMFSWPLSSGARGGSGIKELTIRAGTFSCKETFGLNRLLQRNRSGAFTSGTPL